MHAYTFQTLRIYDRKKFLFLPLQLLTGNKPFTSASDITQAEKSWMSRLLNPKLATIGQVKVCVGLSGHPWPSVHPQTSPWDYSDTGGGTPLGHTQFLRPRNLWHVQTEVKKAIHFWDDHYGTKKLHTEPSRVNWMQSQPKESIHLHQKHVLKSQGDSR